MSNLIHGLANLFWETFHTNFNCLERLSVRPFGGAMLLFCIAYSLQYILSDVLSDRVRYTSAYKLHISSCVKAYCFFFSPSSRAQWQGIKGVRRDEGLAKEDNVQSLPSHFCACVDNVLMLMHACHPLWHHLFQHRALNAT